MIKLVASDIDGTLVPEGTTSINPEFYEIIRKLKEKGILFVGASGRQYSSMRALLDPVFDDIIFISGNGTNIMQKGEKLYSMGMNQADVARLIAYMRTLPDCFHGPPRWMALLRAARRGFRAGSRWRAITIRFIW